MTALAGITNPDGGQYTGPRNTEATFAGYLDKINTAINWDIETSDGESVLPFSITSFSTDPTAVKLNNVRGFSLFGMLGIVTLGMALAVVKKRK